MNDMAGDHLNSVFIKNEFLYAIAHGHNKGSALATFSYPDLHIIAFELFANCFGLHNIWVTGDGQKISCHSEAGSVVDLTTNETLWDSGSPIYIRGLAATSELVLVGESQKTGRELRRSSMSGLWLLDRQTWQALDYICLGPYGAVNEVRLINVADEAHHGHPFEGLAGLLTRDLRATMADERMKSARLASRYREAWASFRLVYGAPGYADHYSRVAAAENLCLITQTCSPVGPERQLDFRYFFDGAAENSHVSAVMYGGNGGDTDMHAILLQPASRTHACLTLWTHDGSSWSAQPGIEVQGLPLSAQVRVRANSTHVELDLNHATVLSL